MKNLGMFFKKCIKNVLIAVIYAVTFVPNFIIGFYQGFKGENNSSVQ